MRMPWMNSSTSYWPQLRWAMSKEKLLVINAGSSSLKFHLYEVAHFEQARVEDLSLLYAGHLSGIGTEIAHIRIRGPQGQPVLDRPAAKREAEHLAAAQVFLARWFTDNRGQRRISLVTWLMDLWSGNMGPTSWMSTGSRPPFIAPTVRTSATTPCRRSVTMRGCVVMAFTGCRITTSRSIYRRMSRTCISS